MASSERRSTSRPDVKDIKDAYDRFFCSGQPISKIKDAALRGHLFADADKDEEDGADVGRGADDDGDKPQVAGVVGRSMAWKLFLVENEPLQPYTTDGIASPPLAALQRSRQEYQRLLLERMRAPDGSYEDGFMIPGTGRSPPRTQRTTANLDLNNPLSLHDENPWTAWFASMDLRKEILQDVERTFPDIGYFRDPDVQAQLTNILFLYAVTHPDIGYRQGMHELLAPLYYAVDYDSIFSFAIANSQDASSSAKISPVEEFCSRAWVAADAWALFSSVMRGVGRWYEWREPKPSNDPNAVFNAASSTSSPGKSALPGHVHINAGNTEQGMQAYVAPIVETCSKIQNKKLKSVDPQTWKCLHGSGIEPQMYGIRWLRLLFTREFSMEDAMLMWDALFACDPSFELAPWICVAMLIRIRNHLIPSDYSTQLTYLLRYPSTTAQFLSSSFSSTSSISHPCTLLIRQALTLQMSPTTATGTSIIHENSNLLNIPPEVPDSPPQPAVRRRGTASGSTAGIGLRASSVDGGSRTHVRQSSTPMGIPEMIARGLLERGESLGINKTVMNAVSEFKRNLPDLANSLTRLPSPMMTPATQYAAYPLVDERPPAERPPWEPRTRFEMEKDIVQLQGLQRKLGDSVGWIVDTLLLDGGEEGDSDEAERKSVRERKREAVECLAYVRDVLKGIVSAGEVEDDRLISEEEVKKRKAKQREAEEKAAAAIATAEAAKRTASPERAHITLTPPQPAAKALPPLQGYPQPAAAPARRSQDYFTVPTSLSRSPPNVAPITSSIQSARQRAPSPTPTINVLPSNKNAVPLAPWNHTRSAFATNGAPLAALPRMPSRPSAVASVRHNYNSNVRDRLTPSYAGTTQGPSQTPPGSDQPPPSGTGRRQQQQQQQQQDPLGVLG